MAQNDLTQGSITRQHPEVFAAIYDVIFPADPYGLADLFVIGQYCDVASTTAVSNGAQIMHMFTVVIIGLAMGTTVRIARAIGAGDRENAARTIGNTFTLFTIVAIITTAILLAANKGIVNLIDTPQEAVVQRHNRLSKNMLHRHPVHHSLQHHRIHIQRSRRLEKSDVFRDCGLRGKHRARPTSS